jgi:hypothetical membrane protein
MTRIGALAWVLAIQFFVAQGVVQSAWTTPFSLAENYISDLGNTTCGPSEVGRNVLYVCSPWHAWMNASFVLLGITILAGAVLTRRAFPPGWAREVGLALVAISGPAVVLVGLYPEDLNLPYHKLGAGVQFILGNLGMAVLGAGMLRRRTKLGVFSIVAGVVGLSATALFVAEVFLGIGIGGMERVAAYPLSVWQIVAGVALLTDRRAADYADTADRSAVSA